MEVLLGFLAALSFLAVFGAFTLPRRRGVRAQAEERVLPEQLQLKEARGLGFLMPTLQGLADALMGREGTAGINTRYLALLKQADWYWGPGEPAPPNPDAPFWNLETMWAAKVFRGLVLGLGGVLFLGLLSVAVHLPPISASLGLLAGVAGFFDPDAQVAEAADRRRRQIVLEMGYKVPELRVYVRSGRTFVSALRYITSRPGGPFVKELHRALVVHDITADLERGLRAVMEHNRLCEPLVNLCADLLAVLTEGGELAPVLETHAAAAQHEQRRLLRQQGQENTQQMTYVVAFTTLIVMFLLIAGPALWTVVVSLGGL